MPGSVILSSPHTIPDHTWQHLTWLVTGAVMGSWPLQCTRDCGHYGLVSAATAQRRWISAKLQGDTVRRGVVTSIGTARPIIVARSWGKSAGWVEHELTRPRGPLDSQWVHAARPQHVYFYVRIYAFTAWIAIPADAIALAFLLLNFVWGKNVVMIIFFQKLVFETRSTCIVSGCLLGQYW